MHRDPIANLELEGKKLIEQKLEVEAAERKYQLKRRQMLHTLHGGEQPLQGPSHQEASLQDSAQSGQGNQVNNATPVGRSASENNQPVSNDGAANDHQFDGGVRSFKQLSKVRAGKQPIREVSTQLEPRSNEQPRSLERPESNGNEEVWTTSNRNQYHKSSNQFENTTAIVRQGNDAAEASRPGDAHLFNVLSKSAPATSIMAANKTEKLLGLKALALEQEPPFNVVPTSRAVEPLRKDLSSTFGVQTKGANVLLLSQLPLIEPKSQGKAAGSASSKHCEGLQTTTSHPNSAFLLHGSGIGRSIKLPSNRSKANKTQVHNLRQMQDPEAASNARTNIEHSSEHDYNNFLASYSFGEDASLQALDLPRAGPTTQVSPKETVSSSLAEIDTS